MTECQFHRYIGLMNKLAVILAKRKKHGGLSMHRVGLLCGVDKAAGLAA